MTRQIADMTIGELEAMLDLQNVDPLKALEIIKEFRVLFRVLVRITNNVMKFYANKNMY